MAHPRCPPMGRGGQRRIPAQGGGAIAAAEKILVDYYDYAAKRLQEMMLHPLGRTDRAREFNQARAAVLLDQVETVRRQLKQQAARLVAKAITAAAKSGVATADRQAEEAGIRPAASPLRGSFHLVNFGAVQVMARDAASDLSKAADSMADTTARILRRTAQLHLSEAQINKMLVRGIIEGDPRGTIRVLAEEFQKVVGQGGMVQAGKMTFKPRHYARMVAITKTRQAAVVAQVERLRTLNIHLVAITGKVSKNFCTAFLGQVFYIGDGQHPKYPRLDTLPSHGPPFHPNCSKSIRPYVEALASEEQKQKAQGVPDAEKLLGVSPTEAQRRYKDLQIEQQVNALQAAAPKAPPSPKAREFGEDSDANHAWATQNWRLPKLDAQDVMTLKDYQAVAYKSLNKRLRQLGNLSAKERQITQTLDRAISQSRVPEPIIVHRGTNLTGKQVAAITDHVDSGLPWSDPAFGSATLRPDKAVIFADGRQVPVVWEIRVPGGTQALYPAALTNIMAHENEVIFVRGMKLRILKVSAKAILGKAGFAIRAEVIQ